MNNFFQKSYTKRSQFIFYKHILTNFLDLYVYFRGKNVEKSLLNITPGQEIIFVDLIAPNRSQHRVSCQFFIRNTHFGANSSCFQPIFWDFIFPMSRLRHWTITSATLKCRFGWNRDRHIRVRREISDPFTTAYWPFQTSFTPRFWINFQWPTVWHPLFANSFLPLCVTL